MLLFMALHCAPVLAEVRHVPMGPIEDLRLNVEIFRLVNDHHTPALDWFFVTIAPYYYVLPVLAIAVIAWRRTTRALLAGVGAVAIETVIVHLLKHFLNQPRPGAALYGVHLLVNRMQGSFPSGDVAMVFAAAASLTRFAPRWALVVLYLYGVLIAYERMYVGVHFPLDVVAGAVIGLACGYMANLWIAGSRKPADEATAD